MSFDAAIAEIRFGEGLSPSVIGPRSVDEMLGDLAGPDDVADVFPIEPYSVAQPSLRAMRLAGRAASRAPEGAERDAAQLAQAELADQARAAALRNLAFHLSRSVATRVGLRERLTRFWADHFTAWPFSGTTRHLHDSYVEEVVRQNVTGRFADMLRAVIVSPLMIKYLDQHASVGPNSVLGTRHDRGLNENLAREMLELHTLGVDAAYSQQDVREFAELLTGLSFQSDRGFYFRPQAAEPGPETFLDQTFGGAEPSLDDVLEAMDALAAHPATARHLAWKMAVHFIGPDPARTMVDRMTERYLETGGSLFALVEAMLITPEAWGPSAEKVKAPIDFVTSALRALDVDTAILQALERRDMVRYVTRPMAAMGQRWQHPPGPDGWPEEAESWVTPFGIAGRISWAMDVPGRLLSELPDPRSFARDALGTSLTEAVSFAAQAAETRAVGVGLVLASAAFQRR